MNGPHAPCSGIDVWEHAYYFKPPEQARRLPRGLVERGQLAAPSPSVMRRSKVASAVETKQEDIPIRGIARRAAAQARARHPPAPRLRPAIRVLVADGQALVRAGVRLLLEVDERITVVGEGGQRRGRPWHWSSRSARTVVMIDTRLPGLDSVEATRRIVAESGVAVDGC